MLYFNTYSTLQMEKCTGNMIYVDTFDRLYIKILTIYI